MILTQLFILLNVVQISLLAGHPYIIEIKDSFGKCLHAPGDGGNAAISDCNGSAEQKWFYQKESKAIKHVSSGKCLDVTNFVGPNVQVYDCKGNTAQQWEYHQDKGEIKNEGKCLDVANWVGPNVQIIGCNGATAQIWHISLIGEYGLPAGLLQIKNPNTGKCLDVENWVGPNVQVYDCKENTAQKWFYDPVNKQIKDYGNGKCLGNSNDGNVELVNCYGSSALKWNYNSSSDTIEALTVGKCLDVANWVGPNVHLHGCNGATAQKWHISLIAVLPNGLPNGYFTLKNVNGKSLDVANWVGPNVQVWNYNSATAQQWIYHPLTGELVNHNGKCLDVWNHIGPNVQVYDCSSNGLNTAQIWYYDPLTLAMKNVIGKCLDVWNYIGPNVQVYNCSSNGLNTAQQWFPETKRLQYGFAHRVNAPNTIAGVLNNGANGIEIDVCTQDDTKDVWYVSHNDAGVCACSHCVTLSSWLSTLKNYFTQNPRKTHQLAMLWIDIKTTANIHIEKMVDDVHSAGLPLKLKILYDLTDLNNNGKSAFDRIVRRLNINEGVSFYGGSNSDVDKIYQYYKSKTFTRGTFNHGHSINTQESVLRYARDKYTSPTDPYRFKLVLTWTNNEESSIRDHTDPSGNEDPDAYTDGQIYGNALRNWFNQDSVFINTFNDAVGLFSKIERLATANDNPFTYHFYNLWDSWSWKGTAPWCGGGCTDCPSGWECIATCPNCNGNSCSSGTKALCGKRASGGKQMSPFIGNDDIDKNNKPINHNNHPETPYNSINPNINLSEYVLTLKSRWIIGIICVLGLILIFNVAFMCYNCVRKGVISFDKKRKSGYSSVKVNDSENDSANDSELNAINVAS